MGGALSLESRLAPLFDGGRVHAGCAIAQPELRGLTLAQLRRLVRGAEHLCVDQAWARREDGTTLVPETLALCDIARHLAAPLAAERGERSIAELLTRAPQRPLWLVAARPDAVAHEVLRCLEQHARDRGIADDDAVYWLEPLALTPREAASDRARPLLERAPASALALVCGVVSLVVQAPAGGPVVEEEAERAAHAGTAFFRGVWPALCLYLAAAVERPGGGGPVLHDIYATRQRAHAGALAQQGSGEAAPGAQAALLPLMARMPSLAASESALSIGAGTDDAAAAGAGRRAVGLVDGFALRDGGSAHTKARREGRFPLQALEAAAGYSLRRAIAHEQQQQQEEDGTRQPPRAAGANAEAQADADAEGRRAEREILAALLRSEEAHTGGRGHGLNAVDATVRCAFAAPLLALLLEAGEVAAHGGDGGDVTSRADGAGARHRLLRACLPAPRGRGGGGGGALGAALRSLRCGLRQGVAVRCLEPPPPACCRALGAALPPGLKELRATRLHAAALLPAVLARLPPAPHAHALHSVPAQRQGSGGRLGSGGGGNGGNGGSGGLESLELRDCGLADAHAAQLAHALARNGSLLRLELPGNAIGDAGCCALAAALLGGPVPTAAAAAAAATDPAAAAWAQQQRRSARRTGRHDAPVPCQLQLLNLGECRVGDAGASALGAALSATAPLEMTTESPAGAPAGTAAEPAAAVAQPADARPSRPLCALQALDLRMNHISDEGAAGLSACLSANCSLTALDLKLNQIADSGAAALAASLRNNTTLTSLDLFYNAVGDNGAVALADCLRHNGALTSLDLFFNRIGDVGAAALGACLPRNGALALLDVRENSLSPRGAQRLAAAWRTSGRLPAALGAEGAAALHLGPALPQAGAQRAAGDEAAPGGDADSPPAEEAAATKLAGIRR